MASNAEYLESAAAAEQNILILKELKAAIRAKNQLLKLQIEEQSTFTTNHNYDPQLATDELHESIIMKTNVDNTFFNLFTKLVLDAVSQNDEGDAEIFAIKKKLLETLQQSIQSSDETLSVLVEKLHTLKSKDQQLRKELREARAKFAKKVKDQKNAEKKKRDTNPLLKTYDETKKEIIERVKKINALRGIINGLVLNLNMDWSNNPEIEEIMRHCSVPYNIDEM